MRRAGCWDLRNKKAAWKVQRKGESRIRVNDQIETKTASEGKRSLRITKEVGVRFSLPHFELLLPSV